MLPILFLLISFTVVLFFLIAKNGKNQNKGPSHSEKGLSGDYAADEPSSFADKPVNPRQAQIDRDKALAKKIFIYGGGAMLVILIAGILFALNPDMGLGDKMETVQMIGIPIVAVLAIIGIGSILPKAKKAAPKTDKKADDFYKSYFIDQHGIRHDQSDYNFLRELKLYSDHNRKYYNVVLKEYEADHCIVDGYGSVIDIRGKEYVILRDNNGNYCNLKIR
jgi:hypothetical protein